MKPGAVASQPRSENLRPLGWAAFFLAILAGVRGLPVGPAYNARVDRLDAIRLLQALVAAGADSRTPMASAWVRKIAMRDMGLQGTELASAIAYAEAEGWLVDIPTRKDLISLTRTGEVIAKAK